MAQDQELDRLASEQDRAFEYKQRAWQAQDDAWKAYQAAQAEVDRLYKERQRLLGDQDAAWRRRREAQQKKGRARDLKQPAYERQQAAWEILQGLRDRYGSRLDQLHRDHDDLFEQIQRNSSEIEAAFNRSDRSTAFDLIEENKRLNERLREYPAEWRPMHAEINEAKDAHARAEAEFRPLQDEFVRLRTEFDAADAEHQRAEQAFQATTPDFERAKSERDAAKKRQSQLAAEYREAKAEAEKAKEAFHARREELRKEADKRKEDQEYLAREAGVPQEYWDDLVVSVQGAAVNFYFGGIGTADGPGHGHYVFDTSTHTVTYSRDPDEEHGAHNFTDYVEGGRNGRSRSARRPDFDSQYHDDGVAAGLTQGGTRNYQSPVHGTDADGRDVTVSFGRDGTPAEGHTLIAEGHKTSDEFYQRNPQIGHDHHSPEGTPGDQGDRGNYSG